MCAGFSHNISRNFELVRGVSGFDSALLSVIFCVKSLDWQGGLFPVSFWPSDSSQPGHDVGNACKDYASKTLN